MRLKRLAASVGQSPSVFKAARTGATVSCRGRQPRAHSRLPTTTNRAVRDAWTACRTPDCRRDLDAAIGDTMKTLVPAYIDKLARIWAFRLTEKELTQAVAFAESPVGRSIADKGDAIAADMAPMGADFARSAATGTARRFMPAAPGGMHLHAKPETVTAREIRLARSSGASHCVDAFPNQLAGEELPHTAQVGANPLLPGHAYPAFTAAPDRKDRAMSDGEPDLHPSPGPRIPRRTPHRAPSGWRRRPSGVGGGHPPTDRRRQQDRLDPGAA